jgi:diguanylate cyclase (GGDEF)-like protein
VAERLRERYADMTVLWKGARLRGTISIGVADADGAGMDLAGLVTASDEALYRAKAAGRNRVACHAALLVHSPFAGAPAAV